MPLLESLLRKRPQCSLLLVARRRDSLIQEARRAATIVLKDDRPLRLRHPDYQELNAESASTDAVRSWLATTESKPFEGGRAVLALLNADFLEDAAANAVLKTLEEPPVATTLLLTASNVARLLPTILSRVFRVYVSVSDIPDSKSLRSGVGFLSELEKKDEAALSKLETLETFQEDLENALSVAPNAASLSVLLEHLKLAEGHVGQEALAASLRRHYGAKRP